MTITLKHKFVSAKADGSDATIVRPSNWNDNHDLLMATASLLGRYSAGAGAAQEIGISSNLTFGSGTLDLSTAMLATINAKANSASPALTGVPTAPTAAVTVDNTQIATTGFVHDVLPTGVVVASATTAVPTGWLECNGTAVSRTTYSALFARIGTTFGAGNGSTTFNLPDLRGEFIRGYDNARDIDTSRVFGSWQDHMYQRHNHRIYYANASNTQTGGGGNRVTDFGGGQQYDILPSVNPIGNAGAETRPRNVAMMYIIKAC